VDNKVFIGIGSNLGDSIANCRNAISDILLDERAGFLGLSSLYRTSPVSSIVQRDFVNCAVSIEWRGSPADLLELLQQIEVRMGRTREVTGGPRTIDLDILLFSDMVLQTPLLTIPHKELHKRKFSLVPCIEINPDLVHPHLGRRLTYYLGSLGDDQRIALLDERVGP
jgi:2-amino-4-hydroxy-6-hydroxymethyldihydropteridine diphosphokinase